VLRSATPAEEEEIKMRLLATSGRNGVLDRHANFWHNPMNDLPGGYHSIQIGNLNLTGQRNPNERLAILRQFLDFRDKVVVDLGCNVGGMLHHLTEVKHAYGFDYDARSIKAAMRIAQVFHLRETFRQADLNTFDPAATFSTLKHTPDIVFMLSIGSWVAQWPTLFEAVANTGVQAIVLETNNDDEGKPQQDLFRRLGKHVKMISQSRDDITGNSRRRTYLVTPRMAAANGQWGEKQRPSLPLSICSGSELSLSKVTCEALQDIRLLGTGTGRSAWEARVSGNVCEYAGEVCEKTVVRKSRSSMGDQTVAEADENSMREAKLMKLLQIQYGTAGSMRFYGVCCDAKFAGSGMSMVVEKLKPVLTMGTRQAMASPRSNGVNKPADALQEQQLHAFAERMANFSEGPMVLHDFKWSSLGLNKQGQVHGIDIAYV
jgi:hypothetical protein